MTPNTRAFERSCGPSLAGMIAAAAQNLPKKRMVARNIEWDGRVPPERQTHFEKTIADADLTKRVEVLTELSDALRFYKKNHIDASNSSSFERSLNGLNEIVPDDCPEWCRLPTSFGTVLNLSWLSGIFQAARTLPQCPLFRTFPPAGKNSQAETEWFEQNFAGRSFTEQNDFLQQAFAAIFEYRKANGQKPVWVAEWDRLAAVLDLPADNWLHYVGCDPSLGFRQLVIVLRYGPRDGMPPLFRPSQLDSGDNCLHFPLPGKTATALGGFTVNSTHSLPSDTGYVCSREWIHSPFLWKPEFFTATDRKWGWAGGSGSLLETQIAASRLKHSSYIRQRLNIPPTWMPNVNE